LIKHATTYQMNILLFPSTVNPKGFRLFANAGESIPKHFGGNLLLLLS
jgi:hypothetical protein